MLAPGAVRFRDVTKTYQIMQRATPRVGAWLLSKALEYIRREPFEALSGVSFDFAPGEMVGLLGHNGAGKSTVLKLIAGITPPTSGTVEVNGTVASLLELGVGFHPDLTGMENIFYNGAMMGLTKRRILERLDEIIRFSGLADFLYEPVKHYSSGMYSRLACSVALHLDPQIILVDEILAVGDAEFQQRGILKILELHRAGVTTILVTHETATARDLCDRLIWIENGRLRDQGDPRRIHNEYLQSMMSRTLCETPFSAKLEPDPRFRIEATRFLVNGKPATAITTGDAARLEVDIAGEGEAVVGILWRWTDGRVLTEDFSPPLELSGQRTLVYEIPRWPLIRSHVTAALVIASPDRTRVYAREMKAAEIAVETPGFPHLDVLEAPKVVWTVEKLGRN